MVPNETTPLLAPNFSDDVYSEHPAGTSSMAEIAISQQQLVSEMSGQERPHPGKKLNQYLAAIAATLGALAAGTVLGWSSPLGPKLKDGEYGFPVTESQLDWISSLPNLGAAASCAIIGFPLDKFGRKWTMITLVIPFVGGWAFIVWANGPALLMVGRFIVGMAGGAFCVTAPTYTSEIAQDSIRGTLGSYFQLLLTVGILFAYAVGSYAGILLFNLLCALFPIIFAVVFFFMPESPTFLVSKNKDEEALKVLVHLRGSKYDNASELQQLRDKVDETNAQSRSFRQLFSSLAAKKALLITLSLMFFQQFSGINAVIFNTTKIFRDAGSSLDEKIATIIVGVMQVVATFVSTLVVDRLGRKILLMLSSSLMALSAIALGVYFYLLENDQDVESISVLPLISLCVYIVMFSIGFGPIPWMIVGELASTEIKAIIASTGGTFNWLLAFTITSTFGPLTSAINNGPTFWIFAGFNVLGFLFVLFVVPETKGKSLNDIQIMLNGGQVTNALPSETIKGRID